VFKGEGISRFQRELHKMRGTWLSALRSVIALTSFTWPPPTPAAHQPRGSFKLQPEGSDLD